MSKLKRGDKVRVVSADNFDKYINIQIGNVYTVAGLDPDGDIYVPCLEINPTDSKPYDYTNYVDGSEHIDGYVLLLSQVEVIK